MLFLLIDFTLYNYILTDALQIILTNQTVSVLLKFFFLSFRFNW